MSIKLISTDAMEKDSKVRLRFSITGAHKSALARESLQIMARGTNTEAGEADLYEALCGQFGTDTVEACMASYVCLRLALPAVREQALDIMYNPEPAGKTIPGLLDKRDAVIDAEVFVRPEAKLSSYEPVYLHVPAAEVTEEQINAQVAKEMNRFATYEEADEPAREGDCLQVNLSTIANGAPEMGLSGDGLAIVLSGDLMPAGFVNGVVGMNVGEHREFSFDNLESTGELVHYQVAVDLVDKRRRIVPELTDEFVRTRLSEDDKTVEEFRARVAAYLKSKDGEEAVRQREELADEELGSRLLAAIPDALVERAAADMTEAMRQNAAAQDMTLDQFAAANGMDTQQLGMQVMMQARESLRQGLALDALFEHLGMELDDEDIARALEELAPGHAQEAKADFQANDAWFIVQTMARRQCAHAWLMETAVFE